MAALHVALAISSAGFQQQRCCAAGPCLTLSSATPEQWVTVCCPCAAQHGHWKQEYGCKECSTAQHHSMFSSCPGASATTNAVTGGYKRLILTLWYKLQHLSTSQRGFGNREDRGARAGWGQDWPLPQKGCVAQAPSGAAPPVLCSACQRESKTFKKANPFHADLQAALPSEQQAEKVTVTTGCPLALLRLQRLAGAVLQVQPHGHAAFSRQFSTAMRDRSAGRLALFSAIALLGPGWILPKVSLGIQIHRTLFKSRYMKDSHCLTKGCFAKAFTSGSNHSWRHSSGGACFLLAAPQNPPGTATHALTAVLRAQLSSTTPSHREKLSRQFGVESQRPRTQGLTDTSRGSPALTPLNCGQSGKLGSFSYFWGQSPTPEALLHLT